MKVLLPTLLLASATMGSYARQAAPYPVARATHADSVEVIHQAFRRARRFARLGTLAEGLAAGTQVSALASGGLRDSPGRQTLASVAAVGYSFFLGDFVVHWVRFSKHREALAIQRFELHQPQPLYVQRRLVTYRATTRKP